MKPTPYTLEELEGEPVDDIWGVEDTRIVVTKERVQATLADNARLRAALESIQRDARTLTHADEHRPGESAILWGIIDTARSLLKGEPND